MSRGQQQEFVRYNKILGKEASIGPIPANQVIPWVLLIIIAYILTNVLTNFGLGAFAAIAIWLVVSYWILTGSKPYQYLDKWRSPPGKDWCNANKIYISLLPALRPRWLYQKYADSVVRIRLKPRIVPRQKGGKDRFMPFQNEVNLCCLAQIKKEGREATGYLLELGQDQYQLVFVFELEGIHDVLTQDEVNGMAVNLEEGFKYVSPGERMTFFAGCYSNDLERQQNLEDLANQCDLLPVSVVIRNEQKRVRELAQKGSRQVFQQYVFCTWTSDASGSSATKDWWSTVLRSVDKLNRAVLGNITGNTRFYQEQFYQKLLLKAFQEGFLPWEQLMTTKMGLNVRPCRIEEIWQFLWNRFNQGQAPAVPQVITLEEIEDGTYKIYETKMTEKHPVTVLIEGYAGESTCPQHYEKRDSVTLQGLGENRKCGVLTMEEAPLGWLNTREQLRWIWKAMSNGFIQDTELFVELSPANNFLIQDNLSRQAKQSKAARERSVVKGQGRDVGAELKQDESFEAQARLYQGVKALHCAPVFLVYRQNEEQLDVACNMLANSFDTARVIRERNIAWDIWLQTLPITTKRLLASADLFGSERRLTPDSSTVAGFLPLTMPKRLDKKGVELMTDRGGRPVHIDLFGEGAKRLMITGTSGSGKSVVAWRFVMDALANGIPVVGMDISSGGDSTFKTAVSLLGDQGAYFDISRGSSNLMEPPDLRKFDKAERQRRMESWKEFILKALRAIAIGKIDEPHLGQRVEALLQMALDKFLKDPDIVDRYNQAFEKGWLSEEWQQIPTLKDFVRYCTRERLDLKSYEDLDRQSLNQITSQIQALLVSRIGKAIAQPSSFSPEPAVKFFALSGLTSEQDSYLMAINAHSACIRNALSHPRSLFIGDELSVLLKKDGFAQVIGETCATGRKDGIAVVLIGQDPDSFYNCSAGAQIMQNMNYRLTGRITSSAALSFQKLMDYPAEIISQNATEAFLPKASELYSCWLVEKEGRFWRVRYYPGDMILASIANNQDEQAARRRIMAGYRSDEVSQLRGLKVFADAYVNAVREGMGFDHIGQSELEQGHLIYPTLSEWDESVASGDRADAQLVAN
jgi:hypothetical protein